MKPFIFIGFLLLPILYSTAITSTSVNAIPSSHSSSSSTEAILWVSGIFDNSVNETMMYSTAYTIATSGFTTIILDFLHYHNDTIYYYNNIPLTEAIYLPQVLSIMKNTSYSSVRTILFSIGGAGVNDYDNIHQYWKHFSTTFPLLLQSYGINGFDIDIEDSTWYPETMRSLVLLGHQYNLYVTATPPDIAPNAYWLDLITTTKISSTNYSALQRIQLQLYSNFPITPAQRILQWTTALQPILQFSGQLNGYLAPGFEISTVFPNQTIPWIHNLLPNSLPYHSINGIFCYDYSQLIFPTPIPNITAHAYAQAIFQGLNLSSSDSNKE